MRGFLCRRHLQERLRSAAAAAELRTRRLARSVRAWRGWALTVTRLRARLQRRAAKRGEPLLPLLAAAAVLQSDGKWGLAAAHCSRQRVAQALYAWITAVASRRLLGADASS